MRYTDPYWLPGYDAWKLREPDYLQDEPDEVFECEDEDDDAYFERIDNEHRQKERENGQPGR